MAIYICLFIWYCFHHFFFSLDAWYYFKPLRISFRKSRLWRTGGYILNYSITQTNINFRIPFQKTQHTLDDFFLHLLYLFARAEPSTLWRIYSECAALPLSTIVILPPLVHWLLCCMYIVYCQILFETASGLRVFI